MTNQFNESGVYFRKMMEKNSEYGVVFDDPGFSGYQADRCWYSWKYLLCYLIEFLKQNNKQSVSLIVDSLTAFFQKDQDLQGLIDIQQSEDTEKHSEQEDDQPEMGSKPTRSTNYLEQDGNVLQSWKDVKDLLQIYGGNDIQKEYITRHAIIDKQYQKESHWENQKIIKNKFCFIRHDQDLIDPGLFQIFEEHWQNVNFKLEKFLEKRRDQIMKHESSKQSSKDVKYKVAEELGLWFGRLREIEKQHEADELNKPFYKAIERQEDRERRRIEVN